MFLFHVRLLETDGGAKRKDQAAPVIAWVVGALGQDVILLGHPRELGETCETLVNPELKGEMRVEIIIRTQPKIESQAGQGH